MAWQFRRSKKVGPFRLTATKNGVSFSVGSGPLRYSFNSRGDRYRTIRIPGTGIYKREKIRDDVREEQPELENPFNEWDSTSRDFRVFFSAFMLAATIIGFITVLVLVLTKSGNSSSDSLALLGLAFVIFTPLLIPYFLYRLLAALMPDKVSLIGMGIAYSCVGIVFLACLIGGAVSFFKGSSGWKDALATIFLPPVLVLGAVFYWCMPRIEKTARKAEEAISPPSDATAPTVTVPGVSYRVGRGNPNSTVTVPGAIYHVGGKNLLKAEKRETSRAMPAETKRVISPHTSASGVDATEEELAAYDVIRKIGSQVVASQDIVLRDLKTYCAVLYRDNNRKPIARLWFNQAQKRLGLFDEDKTETKHDIEGVSDIYGFADEIVARLEYLKGDD